MPRRWTQRCVFKAVSCLWALGSAVGVYQEAEAEVFLVRPDGTGDFPTIIAAVEAAADGDTIELEDGVFRGVGNRNIHMTEDVSVRSRSGNSKECVIDCEGSVSSPAQGFDLVFVQSATFEGLTIRNGYVATGAAMSMWGSSPLIRNCIFENNTALQGGAFCFARGEPVLERCVIASNVATEFPAGGIFCDRTELTIRHCTIVGNSSGVDADGPREAGGIALANKSNVLIEHTIIADSPRGEAVWCQTGSTVEVVCSDFFGNAGGDWIGCVEELLGTNQNFSLPPLFCSPDTHDYTLRENSPCAPPGVTECGLVGALEVACQPTPIERLSWGAIRGRYRR